MRDMYTGIFYVNAPTIGAETHLPFGGTKNTGNGHREACAGARRLLRVEVHLHRLQRHPPARPDRQRLQPWGPRRRGAGKRVEGRPSGYNPYSGRGFSFGERRFLLAMHTSHLDERQKDVLGRSSRSTDRRARRPESLARHLNRTMSSATLRNVMAELEKLGYLDHPHTSAGRMPTDEGYRVFVDSLMSHEPLARGEAAAIESELRPRDGSPSQVMEQASQLLSRLAERRVRAGAGHLPYRAAAHRPREAAPARILAVVVSRTGLVTHRVIEVEDDLSQEQLQECANYLNANFSGLSLDAIRERLVEMMRARRPSTTRCSRRWSRSAAGRSTWWRTARTSISGAPPTCSTGRSSMTWAACGPFQDIRGEGPAGPHPEMRVGRLRVFIGHEVPHPELQDLSLVTASYAVDGEKGWGLGVLGSTRMEYGRIVSVVDHVARVVAQALQEMHRQRRRREGPAGRGPGERPEAVEPRPEDEMRRCAAKPPICATISCASARSSRTSSGGPNEREQIGQEKAAQVLKASSSPSTT